MAEDPGDAILYAHMPPSTNLLENAWKMPEITAPELPEDYPIRLIIKESPAHSIDNATAGVTSFSHTKGKQGFIEMHPADAAAADMEDRDQVIVRSRFGSANTIVYISDEIPQGVALASNSSIFTFNRLFAMIDRDPVTGTPWLNSTPVNIAKLSLEPYKKKSSSSKLEEQYGVRL
jgi:anaerobic selenocysteine-containing dehydrogenase